MADSDTAGADGQQEPQEPLELPMRPMPIAGQGEILVPDLDAIAAAACEEGMDPASAVLAALRQWNSQNGGRPIYKVIDAMKAAAPDAPAFADVAACGPPSDDETTLIMLQLFPDIRQKMLGHLDAGNLRPAYRGLALYVKESFVLGA